MADAHVDAGDYCAGDHRATAAELVMADAHVDADLVVGKDRPCMTFLWTWNGVSFGYRDGDHLWTYDGWHVERSLGMSSTITMVATWESCVSALDSLRPVRRINVERYV